MTTVIALPTRPMFETTKNPMTGYHSVGICATTSIFSIHPLFDAPAAKRLSEIFYLFFVSEWFPTTLTIFIEFANQFRWKDEV